MFDITIFIFELLLVFNQFVNKNWNLQLTHFSLHSCKCLSFVNYRLLTYHYQILECNYIRQAIDLLEGLIPKSEDKEIGGDHLRRLIVFSIMWSVGSLLELADRKKVHDVGSEKLQE